ncbi:MAG: TetR/AcrR family transcriptional regulator [bacterium]|nr:TetR/AcrR family transcriptional regulator [bacterium]
MSARRIDRENKKHDIALAAMSVFADHGFDSTSMSRVASEAGIGKGTIYEYFSSKDDLIATSIRLWMQNMAEETEKALEAIPDPESRLRAYVHSFVDMFLTDEKMPRLMVSCFQFFMTRRSDTKFSDTLRIMFRAGVSSIERILLDGMEAGVFRIESYQDAERIAVNLTAFLDGICLDYLATGGVFDLREQVEYYMRYLLEADIK